MGAICGYRKENHNEKGVLIMENDNFDFKELGYYFCLSIIAIPLMVFSILCLPGLLFAEQWGAMYKVKKCKKG